MESAWNDLVWFAVHTVEWQRRHIRWWLGLFALLMLAGLLHWPVMLRIPIAAYEIGLFAIGTVAVIHERRSLAHRQRHAACLARITEIEADTLIPLDEWLEREMARREGKRYDMRKAVTVSPMLYRLPSGVSMLDRITVLSLACQDN